jgi:hypothetical protein
VDWGPTGGGVVDADELFGVALATLERPGIWCETTPTMTTVAATAVAVAHRDARLTRAKTSFRCSSICA